MEAGMKKSEETRPMSSEELFIWIGIAVTFGAVPLYALMRRMFDRYLKNSRRQ